MYEKIQAKQAGAPNMRGRFSTVCARGPMQPVSYLLARWTRTTIREAALLGFFVPFKNDGGTLIQNRQNGILASRNTWYAFFVYLRWVMKFVHGVL